MGSRSLPPLPSVRVEILRDLTPSGGEDEGFLRIRRVLLRNRYDDGAESRGYRYDILERSALDAVALLLWADDDDGPVVCLRSSIRPPLLLRATASIPIPEPNAPVTMWEVPAGLIEPDEVGENGIRACAARETLEETGFSVAADEFRFLGPPATVSPGMVPEKIFFLEARVDLKAQGVPVEDGHPVEERAVISFPTVTAALQEAEEGRIADLKTETGLRRLAERLARSASREGA